MTAAKVLRRIMMTLGNPFESRLSMLTERRTKEIASLSRKKHRDELGQCIIEGARSLESAVDGGAHILEVIVQNGVELDPALTKRLSQPVYSVDSRTIGKISDTRTPSGVVAVVRTRLAEREDIPATGRILMLDGLQDPGNVGTLIRTAAWFGVDSVVAGPGTADFFHPKTLRASMGGVWDVRLHATASSADFLTAMKQHGRTIWVADMQGVEAASWTPGPNDVLVMGSEAHGVGPWILPIADGSVGIPRSNTTATAVESLNVAAAGAVLLSLWATH